jgi:hypothetical protein
MAQDKTVNFLTKCATSSFLIQTFPSGNSPVIPLLFYPVTDLINSLLYTSRKVKIVLRNVPQYKKFKHDLKFSKYKI